MSAQNDEDSDGQGHYAIRWVGVSEVYSRERCQQIGYKGEQDTHPMSFKLVQVECQSIDHSGACEDHS